MLGLCELNVYNLNHGVNCTVSLLEDALRPVLLQSPEITRLSGLRRSTRLFHQDHQAEAVYYIEEGLVKLTRTVADGDRIIFSLFGPGSIIGDESLALTSRLYHSDAEVLTSTTAFRIPSAVAKAAMSKDADLCSALMNGIIEERLAMSSKIELLCKHDVEYRILHYLAELSALVQPATDGDGHQLPITQAELADLVGATRETTSTTLNQLERRGLVRLSRRLLTIPSPKALRGIANHNGTRLLVGESLDHMSVSTPN